LWESMEEVQRYLSQSDPAAAQAANNALQCFAPYNRDEEAYIRATLSSTETCADELEALLQAAQASIGNADTENEAAFNALQNAKVALNAERYYRTSGRSSAQSWNIRDQHMTETINTLVQHHGADAKIIVWEHNTHVGDARYTDMAGQGMVNVGQLVREQHSGEGVYIAGFGTYEGTVIAAQAWGAATKEMQVPVARPGSWEEILHRQEPLNKIILLRGLRQESQLMQQRGHRAIGVVYNPDAESGNYVPTVLPERYDAFLFIDRTTALRPLR
jgi:erythromycin esterase